jgi:hypothetical protein
MLGDLGVSTLRLIKTMAQFSSLLDHQTSHSICFNAWGLLYESSSTPSCFLRRTDLLGNPFLITSLLDLLFLLFSFLDHHAGHSIRHDARILFVSASSMPSNFFIIVSIYWKLASYRSSLDLSSFGKTSNRLDGKLTCYFF